MFTNNTEGSYELGLQHNTEINYLKQISRTSRGAEKPYWGRSVHWQSIDLSRIFP